MPASAAHGVDWVPAYAGMTSNKISASGPDGLVVRRRPTQQELANMIGSCRETISRAFNQLARDGLIIPRGRSLVVTPALIEKAEKKKAA